DADRGGAFDRAVGGRVEVLAEDFPARVSLRVLFGQLRLDDLAFDVAFRVADAQVAHQLLGDRRAALDGFARLQVLGDRPGDALVVERAVFVEALVLDRHRRQLQAPGHAADRHRLVSFAGTDDAELAAVAGVERRVAAAVGFLAAGERGRVGGDVENPGGDREDRDGEDGGDAGADEEKLAADPPAGALAPPVALRHPRSFALWEARLQMPAILHPGQLRSR